MPVCQWKKLRVNFFQAEILGGKCGWVAMWGLVQLPRTLWTPRSTALFCYAFSPSGPALPPPDRKHNPGPADSPNLEAILFSSFGPLTWPLLKPAERYPYGLVSRYSYRYKKGGKYNGWLGRAHRRVPGQRNYRWLLDFTIKKNHWLIEGQKTESGDHGLELSPGPRQGPCHMN